MKNKILALSITVFLLTPTKINANLSLIKKSNQVCLDYFCRVFVKAPFSIGSGGVVFTRNGLAQWKTLFNAAKITQLSCTNLYVRQSEIFGGAMALSLRVSPVIGCYSKPKIIIQATKFKNPRSKAVFSHKNHDNQIHWAEIGGTTMAVSESQRGFMLVGVAEGNAKLDNGRSLPSGFVAEALPSGWAITPAPEPYVHFSTSRSRHGTSNLQVENTASMMVDGEVVDLDADGSVMVRNGSKVTVVSVTGKTLSYKLDHSGVRLTPLAGIHAH